MVNSRASVIMINTLINHRMISLQKNSYRILVVRWMLDYSSMMFPETAHFSERVVHEGHIFVNGVEYRYWSLKHYHY